MTGLLGMPGCCGRSMRHMRQSPVVAGTRYGYRGFSLDSPTLEAAPLPTKESVLESMGHVEGLIPAVWERAVKGRIRLHVQCGGKPQFVVVHASSIEALHAGVIYWGMEQTANQYKEVRDLMPCVYVDWCRLPETNADYFETRLGVKPTEEQPHPELDLLARAKQKVEALGREPAETSSKKPGWAAQEPSPEEWAAYKLPPATRWQSWYPAVRIELKKDSQVRRLTKNSCPVCCMVQIVEWEADYLTAWNLSVARFGLSEEAQRSVAKFTGGMHEQMLIEQ